MKGFAAMLEDAYIYDANANVLAITDGTTGGSGNRSMSYGGLDRLSSTGAPYTWWINASTTYDALDNIRSNTVGNRVYTYTYDATSKRLTQLLDTVNRPLYSLGYDANGNVTSKGIRQDSYVFDAANRMQSVTGKESYQYDGYGRRVKITRISDSKLDYPIYTMGGQLITEDDQRSNLTTDYVNLNGSLVGKRSAPIGTSTWTTKYEHTDALHSPVAESDSAGSVTAQKNYTPYGEPGDSIYVQGPGFTGHVTDAATGLTYAQQRYYDPIIGRFLSVDPVQAKDNGANFNRYWYANNNPYDSTDPDGRETQIVVNGNVSLGDIASWQGKHVGIRVDVSDEHGEPLLFDPNGSYQFGHEARSDGGFFEGASANLGAYIRYEKTDGAEVRLYRFKTTVEEEKKIAARILEGESRGLTCSSEVSRVIDGIGPFKDVGSHMTPLGLENALQKVDSSKTSSKARDEREKKQLDSSTPTPYRAVDDRSSAGPGGSSTGGLVIWE